MKNFRLSPESKENLNEVLTFLQEKIIPRYNELLEIQFPDEDDLEEMKTLKEFWELTKPVIESYSYVLQNSLLQTSKDIFIHIKLEADKGNKDAKMLYEKLKDSHKAMRDEELGEQSN